MQQLMEAWKAGKLAIVNCVHVTMVIQVNLYTSQYNNGRLLKYMKKLTCSSTFHVLYLSCSLPFMFSTFHVLYLSCSLPFMFSTFL
jgi:hypothetical protein